MVHVKFIQKSQANVLKRLSNDKKIQRGQSEIINRDLPKIIPLVIIKNLFYAGLYSL